MVQIVVPLLLASPVLIGMAPLPVDTTLLGGLLMLVPCLWTSVQLIRGPVVMASADAATAAPSRLAG